MDKKMKIKMAEKTGNRKNIKKRESKEREVSGEERILKIEKKGEQK